MNKLTRTELSVMYQHASDALDTLEYCKPDDLRPLRRGVATVLGDLAILDESGCQQEDRTYYQATKQLGQLVVNHFSTLTHKQQLANLPLWSPSTSTQTTSTSYARSRQGR